MLWPPLLSPGRQDLIFSVLPRLFLLSPCEETRIREKRKGGIETLGGEKLCASDREKPPKKSSDKTGEKQTATFMLFFPRVYPPDGRILISPSYFCWDILLVYVVEQQVFF